MLIQNEFCNGGSLQTLLQERTLKESELLTLLLHITEKLKYIHSNDLVHMDLNAGNNFLTKVPIQSTYTGAVHHPNSADDGFKDILHEDFSNLPKADTFSLGISDDAPGSVEATFLVHHLQSFVSGSERKPYECFQVANALSFNCFQSAFAD